MSDFSVFMAGNALKDEIVKVVVSERFAKNGKPVEWELKAVDAETDEKIRKECAKLVPVGKHGQKVEQNDNNKYIGKLCVASTVYPNLNDAELQDSYGVKSADALLKKMLKPGEYTTFQLKVMEINGFDLSMEELVDEAKN
jgi:RecG-like helicase